MDGVNLQLLFMFIIDDTALDVFQQYMGRLVSAAVQRVICGSQFKSSKVSLEVQSRQTDQA